MKIHFIYKIIFIIILIYIFFYYMDKYCENMKYEHYENIFTRHKQIELEKKLLEKPFPMKNNLVSVIPLNLFQTWHTKDLPPKMKKCVESVKKENPDFTYYLMDDKDCRQFLIENFDKEIVWAYDSLIPGAYKADLWRYCILYKLGGIYMDIKYQCSNGFRLKALTDKEYFVNDWCNQLYCTPTLGKTISNDSGIYNAFMVCLPGNKILKKCIDQVVFHIKHQFYGKSSLEPTGPNMMKKFFTPEDREKIELNHYFRDGHVCIRYKYYRILNVYPEYRDEQRKYPPKGKSASYHQYWRMRNIYQNPGYSPMEDMKNKSNKVVQKKKSNQKSSTPVKIIKKSPVKSTDRKSVV